MAVFYQWRPSLNIVLLSVSAQPHHLYFSANPVQHTYFFRRHAAMVKRQTPEFWQAHISAWQQSGITQSAYCATHGLHIKSFGRRLYQAREIAQLSKLPLTLVPASMTPATPINTIIQLHSPGGWRIDLPSTSATVLAELLRQLP